MRFYTFWAIFFISLSALAQASDNKENAVIHIGVSSRTFEKINRNDAAAALKAWAAAIIKEQGLQEHFNVTLFDGPIEELRHAFLQNRLDAVSLTVEEFMLLGVPVEAIYLPAVETGIHVRYAIIVHRDSGIADPDDLIGRKLVICRGQWMVLARHWLETVLADPAGGHNDRRLSALTPVENPSKAILQIYFHQSQAALVTTEAFDLACELNPQLRKDLRILVVSPPFITSFFIFRPSTYPTRISEKLEKAIMELHTTPGGRQVLTVFQSSRMEKHPISILNDTCRFLTEYHRLVHDPVVQETQP